eukprot:6207104-Pleurochrysis_carterae.AAC.7
MRSRSPTRWGGWTRCNLHNPGAWRRTAHPPTSPLHRPLGKIRFGDGGWVKEITSTCARWLFHRERRYRCAQRYRVKPCIVLVLG